MSFFVRIRDWLADPRLAKIDIESDDHLRVHREILSESGLTRDVFQGFYTLCRTLDDRYFSGGTRRVEIGAGLSFFKEVYAENISSDFKCAAGLDLVIDTQGWPSRLGRFALCTGSTAFTTSRHRHRRRQTGPVRQ